MPLKLIGAGYGRTGTMSTYRALNQLGFPCYHMAEVVLNRANRGHLKFWHAVADDAPGSQRDWKQVFANYTAAVDFPASCVWRELMTANPDAKVLLTLHPKGAEAWYDSARSTIYFTETMWQFKLLEAMVPLARRFGQMSRKLFWQRTLGGTMDDRARAIAHYNRHIEELKAAVPPERLLVFSADQGWEPLCRFLGVPVPETPFPDVNDRAEIRRTLAGFKLGAYALMAGLAGLAIGLVYALVHFVS